VEVDRRRVSTAYVLALQIIADPVRRQMDRIHGRHRRHPRQKPLPHLLSKSTSPLLPSPKHRLTLPPQLVQARVVAQASTLVTLIAFGVLAGTHQATSDNSQPQESEDHSWKRILGTSPLRFCRSGLC
jgi:hypothetical protein